MARGKLEALSRDAIRWIVTLVNPVIFRRALAHAIFRRGYFYPSLVSHSSLPDKKFGITAFENWAITAPLSLSNSVYFKVKVSSASRTHFLMMHPSFWALTHLLAFPSIGEPLASRVVNTIRMVVNRKCRINEWCLSEAFFRRLVKNGWVSYSKRHTHKIIVHFDADLYSSTLYGLAKMSELGVPFLVSFDEFYGDECRALSDFCSTFLYKTRVLCSGGRSYSR